MRVELTLPPLRRLPILHRQPIRVPLRLPRARELLPGLLVVLPLNPIVRRSLLDNGADFKLLLLVELAVRVRAAWALRQIRAHDDMSGMGVCEVCTYLSRSCRPSLSSSVPCSYPLKAACVCRPSCSAAHVRGEDCHISQHQHKSNLRNDSTQARHGSASVARRVQGRWMYLSRGEVAHAPEDLGGLWLATDVSWRRTVEKMLVSTVMVARIYL